MLAADVVPKPPMPLALLLVPAPVELELAELLLEALLLLLLLEPTPDELWPLDTAPTYTGFRPEPRLGSHGSSASAPPAPLAATEVADEVVTTCGRSDVPEPVLEVLLVVEPVVEEAEVVAVAPPTPSAGAQARPALSHPARTVKAAAITTAHVAPRFMVASTTACNPRTPTPGMPQAGCARTVHPRVTRKIDSYLGEAMASTHPGGRERWSMPPSSRMRPTQCRAIADMTPEELERPRIPRAPRVPCFSLYPMGTRPSVRPRAPSLRPSPDSDAWSALMKELEAAAAQEATEVTAPASPSPASPPPVEAPEPGASPSIAARVRKHLQNPRAAANAVGLGAAAGILAVAAMLALR